MVATALAVLMFGFLVGFATDRFLLRGDDRTSSAPTATAPTSASAQDSRPDPMGSPALPDPGASPGGEEGFLRALEEVGVSVRDAGEREVVLALGRGFCQGTAEERADQPAAAERILDVVGDRFTADQAKVLVVAADVDLC